jgi:hypothetical protein
MEKSIGVFRDYFIMRILELILELLRKLSFHIRSKWRSSCCNNSFCDCFSDIAVNEHGNNKSQDPPA